MKKSALFSVAFIFVVFFALAAGAQGIRHPKAIAPYGTDEMSFGMCGSLWADEQMPRGTWTAIESSVVFLKTTNGHMWALNLERQDQAGKFQVLKLRDDCHMGEFTRIPGRCISSEERWNWRHVKQFVLRSTKKDEYELFVKELPPFMQKLDINVEK